jgi:hypothetical protein
MTTTVTSFPLSKHTMGGGATPTFSGWHVYLQFTWEVTLHPLLWSFPPTATFTSIPTLASLFFYSSMRDSPLPPLATRAPHPLCYMSFLLLLFIIQFFFLGWGSVSPGGYAELAQGCSWEYHVSLISPGCLLLPSRLGPGIWWC